MRQSRGHLDRGQPEEGAAAAAPGCTTNDCRSSSFDTLLTNSLLSVRISEGQPKQFQTPPGLSELGSLLIYDSIREECDRGPRQ